MEVEGLDGATASLIFFVVVAILVFGCLQVVVVGGGVGLGGVQVFGWRPREVRVRWYDGYGMVWYVISSVLNCESHRIHTYIYHKKYKKSTICG